MDCNKDFLVRVKVAVGVKNCKNVNTAEKTGGCRWISIGGTELW
jgi:hypothetical protein